MDTSRMVFAIAFKHGRIQQTAMQTDGGDAFKKYHKQRGNKVRLWNIAGCERYHEIDEATKQEIREFKSAFGGWDD